MTQSYYKLNTISFTASKGQAASSTKSENSDDDKKKEAAKEAVKGGGAVAATSAAISNKKKVDMFTKASKASKELERGSQTIKNVGNVAEKTTGLLSKCKTAYQTTREAVITWGRTVKTSKYIRPILKSAPFRWGAGLIGYGFGAVTLITGLGDIAKVTTDTLYEYSQSREE